MTPTTIPVDALWAKTGTEPHHYHPLASHLVEVAAVAHELWDTTLPAAVRDRWAAHFGNDHDLAGRWLAALAGWHDLGKASRVFQAQAQGQRTRLVTSGVRLRADLGRLRHGVITASALPEMLLSRWPTMEPASATRLGVVAGIHHGSAFDQGSLDLGVPEGNHRQVGDGTWDVARERLFEIVIDAVGGLSSPPDAPPPHPLATWAAGFISVADWIGSNTDFFPIVHPALDPAEARRLAPERAARALNDLGWTSGHVAVPDDFQKLFAREGWDDPNPTQRATIDAVRRMDGPGLIVVEAPMGQGKTEAAFWVAAHAEAHWGTRGVYIAMPTRASSDQLFGRLEAHLCAHAADGDRLTLLLLHGHAAISAHLEQVRRRMRPFCAASAAPAPDEPDDRRRRTDWFSARRRGLLAPYGVGTVDQTLLGVLENRHHFVRLHGLAGKTVVFDEVHAYDTWMETIFLAHLGALGALGAPVVLLSATLPVERRVALLDAYARGAGWTPEADPTPAAYPAVTSVDRRRVASVGIKTAETPREVALRWFTGGDEVTQREAMIEALVATLAGNHGTCAVICNTVRQAQQIYGLLDARLPGEVDLLHARFRHGDRAHRQERILRAFGKGHGGERGERRRIVVATQVIEQSLDLDFDLMVTAFCPTDLLLQRLGRLHRHSNNDAARPEHLRQPQLWVFGVAGSDDPTWPSLGVPVAGRFVYHPHVLLRSWAVLRGRGTLTLPGDIGRLVEATYTTGAAPPDDLADDWHRSEVAFRQEADAARRTVGRMLTPALSEDRIMEGADPMIRNVSEKTPDEERRHDIAASAIARTRDGPPSVDVVLLRADEAELADHAPASGPLPMEAVAELLSRSVSVSQHGPWHELMAQAPPEVWERTVWLQRHRLLRLDDHGRVQVGKYLFSLSPEVGVEINHVGDPEEE